MPDPVVTTLTSGTSTTATTTVSFTGQAVNTLLLLSITAEAYLTTSGSGRPESTGWTQLRVLGSPQWHASSLWYKIADGSETSVQYTISSAAGSSHRLEAATDIDPASPVDGSNIGNSATNPGGTNTFTGPTVATTAGRRLGYATMHRISGVTTTGMTGLTNSYTQQGATSHTAGDRPAIVTAKLVFDGGSPTGTGGTWAPTTGSNYQYSGIIAAFKVAADGGTATSSPPQHRLNYGALLQF